MNLACDVYGVGAIFPEPADGNILTQTLYRTPQLLEQKIVLYI